jgi:2-dehydro-3-deoxyphosphooctonate aldolase (KDO 8-P synthase)
VDFRGVEVMQSFADAVILDCTHSTQMTGMGKTGGDRELAKRYARAAGIFGYDGVFIEAHPRPEEAISDSDSQVEIEWLTDWIDSL